MYAPAWVGACDGPTTMVRETEQKSEYSKVRTYLHQDARTCTYVTHIPHTDGNTPTTAKFVAAAPLPRPMLPSLQVLLGHDLAHEHILSLVHVLHARRRLLLAQIVLRALIRVELHGDAPIRAEHRMALQRRGRWW